MWDPTLTLSRETADMLTDLVATRGEAAVCKALGVSSATASRCAARWPVRRATIRAVTVWVRGEARRAEAVKQG